MIVTLSHDLVDECCICGRRVQAFVGDRVSLGRFGYALECSRCREALDAQQDVRRPRRCGGCKAPLRVGRRLCAGCEDKRQAEAPPRPTHCAACKRALAGAEGAKTGLCRPCYRARWMREHDQPRARTTCASGCGRSVRVRAEGHGDCKTCHDRKRRMAAAEAQRVGVGR
jgi:hypothetical protein